MTPGHPLGRQRLRPTLAQPSHIPLCSGNSWLSSAGHQMTSFACLGAVSYDKTLLSAEMTGYKMLTPGEAGGNGATENLMGAGTMPDLFTPGIERTLTS